MTALLKTEVSAPLVPSSLLPRKLQVFTRDDGALNVLPVEPGPANCCDGRMVYVFVCRNGISLCTTRDVKRGGA